MIHSTFPPTPRTFAEPPMGLIRPIAIEAEPLSEFRVSLAVKGDSLGGAITNVPHSVVNHSSSGFAWGYRGSGAQELALNILNYVAPPGSDGFEPVKCGEGVASRTAVQLYGKFTSDVIAVLPPEGGAIPVSTVYEWIKTNEKLITNFPRSEFLVPYYSNPTATPLERRMYQKERPPVKHSLVPRSSELSWEDEVRFASSIHDQKAALIEGCKDLVESASRAAELRGKSASERGRLFYLELFKVARVLHGLDVELFRAEVRAEQPQVASLLARLPVGLSRPLEGIVDFMAQKQAQLEKMLCGEGHTEIASELVRGPAVEGIQVQVCGPAFLVTCSTEQAWRQVYRACYGPESHYDPAVGAFQTYRKVRGEPELAIFVPTYALEQWDYQDRNDLRVCHLHEREHALQKIRYFPITGVAELPNDGTLADVEEIIFMSFLESFREEFLSFGLSGEWNRASADNLTPAPGSLYNFPESEREIHLAGLSALFPNQDSGCFEALYDRAGERYRDWFRTARPSLLLLEAADSAPRDGGQVHVALRTLEFFDTVQWPEHVKKMHDLRLLRPDL